MDVAENETQHRRVPTLVQLCQRAAVANTDAIHSLGDLSYSLVKPILYRCTTEQLLRFEQLSPHLENDTSEIWRDLCFRAYHLTAIDRCSPSDIPQDPDSWRSRYFTLQAIETKRIEEIGSRIRTQRQEADERKKEKEVKFTDRVPPAKRLRTGWNNVSQPKTLFQKTRSEASKIQRALNARILPPMSTAKNYRIYPPASGSTLPSAVSSTNRVTVNTITVSRPQAMPTSLSAASSKVVSTFDISQATTPPIKDDVTHCIHPPRESPAMSISSVSETSRPLPKMRSPKKDPMASLFVPKRKLPPTQPS